MHRESCWSITAPCRVLSRRWSATNAWIASTSGISRHRLYALLLLVTHSSPHHLARQYAEAADRIRHLEDVDRRRRLATASLTRLSDFATSLEGVARAANARGTGDEEGDPGNLLALATSVSGLLGSEEMR